MPLHGREDAEARLSQHESAAAARSAKGKKKAAQKKSGMSSFYQSKENWMGSPAVLLAVEREGAEGKLGSDSRLMRIFRPATGEHTMKVPATDRLLALPVPDALPTSRLLLLPCCAVLFFRPVLPAAFTHTPSCSYLSVISTQPLTRCPANNCTP